MVQIGARFFRRAEEKIGACKNYKVVAVNPIALWPYLKVSNPSLTLSDGTQVTLHPL
jgi:hypothetical protein